MAAARSIVCTSLLLVLFVLVLSNVAEGFKNLNSRGCWFHCNGRCSNTKHKGNCIDTCNDCCRRCRCVPSGFYGHEQECSCYNSIKTKEGRHKCP